MPVACFLALVGDILVRRDPQEDNDGRSKAMAIIVRLDVLMAERKVKSIDLAERLGLTLSPLPRLKNRQDQGDAARNDGCHLQDLEAASRGDLFEYIPDEEAEGFRPGQSGGRRLKGAFGARVRKRRFHEIRHDAVLFSTPASLWWEPENGGTNGLTPEEGTVERVGVSDVPDEGSVQARTRTGSMPFGGRYCAPGDVEVDRGRGEAHLGLPPRHPEMQPGPVGDAIRTARRGNAGDGVHRGHEDGRRTPAHAGVRNLRVVSGGEPLLRDDLHEILRYAKGSGGIESVSVLTERHARGKDAVIRPPLGLTVLEVPSTDARLESPAHIQGNERFVELVKAVEPSSDAGVEHT